MGIKYSIRISTKYNLKYTSQSTNYSKMKFSFTLLALVAAEEVAQDDTWYGAGASNSTATIGQRSGQATTDATDADRRYDDLESIAKKYWNKQGMTGKNKFDDRKYWTYGCHCFLLGDRPMSEMGKGRPVDALDNKCKAYKDCQKCVRAKHGDQCIGEFVRYTWKYASKFATSSPTMPTVPANVSSSSAMFSSSRTLSPTRTPSTPTTTLSGRPLASTTVKMRTAHPVELFQLSTSAAVVSMPLGTGLALTTTSAAVNLPALPVLLSAPTTSANFILKSISR